MTKALFTRNDNFDTIDLPNVGMTDEVMTYKNTIQKIALLFGILTVSAAVAWSILPSVALIPLLVVGLVLALVNIFRKEPNPWLISLYALVQGGLLGVISRVYEETWGGVVMQAVLATIAVCIAVVILFSFAKVRATKRLNKFFFVAIIAYMAYSLINLLLMVTGVITTPFGLNGIEWNGIPIGLLIGGFAVLLASYSLIIDFTYIEKAVQNRAPAKQGWYAGFSLLVTVIWMYLEMLRIFALGKN